MSLYSRLVCLITLLAAIATAATAGPISSCVPNAQQLFTCNLFETNADGVFSEDPERVPVGNTVGLGFVVFLEPGIDPTVPANQANVGNWSDVLSFTQSSNQFFVQLFSDPFSVELVRLITAAGAEYFAEAETDPTVFIGGSGNTYNIFSQSAVDTDVPEPGSATLLIVGGPC
jgi:hypothetical protein